MGQIDLAHQRYKSMGAERAMTPLPCNFSFPSGRSTASVPRWSAEPVSPLPQACRRLACPGSAIFLRDWLNLCPDATCRRMASHPREKRLHAQHGHPDQTAPQMRAAHSYRGQPGAGADVRIGAPQRHPSAVSVGGRAACMPIGSETCRIFSTSTIKGMSVLITEQDFYDLAWAYLERAHADNVRHVEMFFDPQGHTSRGIPFATVIEGLHRAIVDAGRKLGVQASLIMCFLRHLDEADAEKTLDSALAFKDRIVGVGLDSSEAGTSAEQIQARVRPRAGCGLLSVGPCRRGRARRATSGKRSTCSASPASITAIVRWRMRHWWGGWPATRSR